MLQSRDGREFKAILRIKEKCMLLTDTQIMFFNIFFTNKRLTIS